LRGRLRGGMRNHDGSPLYQTYKVGSSPKRDSFRHPSPPSPDSVVTFGDEGSLKAKGGRLSVQSPFDSNARERRLAMINALLAVLCVALVSMLFVDSTPQRSGTLAPHSTKQPWAEAKQQWVEAIEASGAMGGAMGVAAKALTKQVGQQAALVWNKSRAAALVVCSSHCAATGQAIVVAAAAAGQAIAVAAGEGTAAAKAAAGRGALAVGQSVKDITNDVAKMGPSVAVTRSAAERVAKSIAAKSGAAVSRAATTSKQAVLNAAAKSASLVSADIALRKRRAKAMEVTTQESLASTWSPHAHLVASQATSVAGFVGSVITSRASAASWVLRRSLGKVGPAVEREWIAELKRHCPCPGCPCEP